MTRAWWKPALGLVVLGVIAAWDVGVPGQYSAPPSHAAANPSVSVAASPSASASASASASPSRVVPAVASIPGVIQPEGTPEFSATFSGSTLNTSVWATCYPYASDDFSTGCTNFGNAGKEGEWYTPSQVQVSNGTLNLVADREPTAGYAADGSPQTYACRSGMVTTYPGFNFEYGYIQIVASIPTGAGLWPALWLAATNLQWPPEMDIVEAWTGDETVDGPTFASTYLHYSTPTTQNAELEGLISPPTRAAGWHTFALSWTPTQMTWLLDGKPLLTTHAYIPHQKMFFIANVAELVTPSQPDVLPGECNGEMQIRSVQVWAP